MKKDPKEMYPSDVVELICFEEPFVIRQRDKESSTNIKHKKSMYPTNRTLRKGELNAIMSPRTTSGNLGQSLNEPTSEKTELEQSADLEKIEEESSDIGDDIEEEEDELEDNLEQDTQVVIDNSDNTIVLLPKPDRSLSINSTIKIV